MPPQMKALSSAPSPLSPLLLAVLRHGLRLQRQAAALWRRGRRSHAPPMLGGVLALLAVVLVMYLGTWAQAIQQQHQQVEALTRAITELAAGTDVADAARGMATAAGLELNLKGPEGRRQVAVPPPEPPPGWSGAVARPLAARMVPELRSIERPDGPWQLQASAPLWALWAQYVRTTTLVLAAGLGGLVLLLLWLRRRQQQLRQAVSVALGQARSLGEAGYVTPDAQVIGVLRPVAQAMDHLHQRLRALFVVHAEQLESLRRQVHLDGLTGLPNRRHFLAVLDAVLSGEQAPPEAGLVLLRLRDLIGMNQRLGGAATDRLLQSIGEVLAAYPSRSERCAVGRLTGGEFALLLPTGGMAHETAQSLLKALAANVGRLDPSADLQAAGVELRPPMGAEQALVMAQAALAAIESSGDAAAATLAAQRRAGLGAATDGQPAARPGPDGGTAPAAEASAAPAAAGGPAATDAPRNAGPGDPPSQDASWQRHLARALVQGRVRLGEFAMRTAEGRQLLLDCPLRVQVRPGGEYEPAARWMHQAARSRLHSVVDEKAVMLALAAIARDGEPRCINVSDASARSAEFVAATTRRLAAAPEAAAQLWIDLPERLALDAPQLVRHLCRQWRPVGTRVALEHCGDGLMRIPRLMDLGLDCVRIDGRYVNGLVGEGGADARRYLQGLVRLVQSVGLAVTAEGVRTRADLELLWDLGFDAATGPAVASDKAMA